MGNKALPLAISLIAPIPLRQLRGPLDWVADSHADWVAIRKALPLAISLIAPPPPWQLRGPLDWVADSHPDWEACLVAAADWSAVCMGAAVGYWRVTWTSPISGARTVYSTSGKI